MTNKKEEQKIQHQIINYCKERGLKVYGTANGQFLNTWSGINERGTLGKGLPDLLILIPFKRSTQGRNKLVFMEVKKATGGRLSKEQIFFIDFVQSIYGDVHAFVAYGFEDAKRQIEPLLNPMSKEEGEQWLKDNNLT